MEELFSRSSDAKCRGMSPSRIAIRNENRPSASTVSHSDRRSSLTVRVPQESESCTHNRAALVCYRERYQPSPAGVISPSLQQTINFSTHHAKNHKKTHQKPTLCISCLSLLQPFFIRLELTPRAQSHFMSLFFESRHNHRRPKNAQSLNAYIAHSTPQTHRESAVHSASPESPRSHC